MGFEIKKEQEYYVLFERFTRSLIEQQGVVHPVLVPLAHPLSMKAKSLDALSDGLDTETNLPQLGGIQDQTTVKNESGLLHGVKDLLVVHLVHLELVPLGADNEGISASASLVSTLAHLNMLINSFFVGANTGLGQVHLDLLGANLGVVDGNASVLLDQVAAESDGSRLTGITGILLEGETEKGNAFVGNCVEEGADNAMGEAHLLVLVHGDD